MPNFEQLYCLCETARRQGYLDWAWSLERKIHELEKLFGVPPRFCTAHEVDKAFDLLTNHASVQ